MRLLAMGDFHRDEALKEAFIEEANSGEYDLVVGIGDYEEPGYYQELVEGVEERFIALTGNWDFGFEPPEDGEYEMLYNYIKAELEGYKLVMLGAVYPDAFMEEVHAFFEGTPPARRIVASHYPPHMLGDLARNGTRAGFQEFRELIMREQPALWLCGHIHEDFGRFSLKDTVVLNAAGEQSGKAWAVTLGEDGVETADEVTLVDQ